MRLIAVLLLSAALLGCATDRATTVHRELIDERIQTLNVMDALAEAQAENKKLRAMLWLIGEKGWGHCS
jgi:hypothetical protein